MAKPARRFAEGTTVPVEKTKSELDALLAKHGAKQRSFAQDDEEGRALVTFALAGRNARLELRVKTDGLPNPMRRDWEQTEDCPRGWNQWTQQRRADWVQYQTEQRGRETWRRLLLMVKAKLEIIADGMSTFEREFLADILLPNGSTLHQAIAARLAESYDSGNMPKLLPETTQATE